MANTTEAQEHEDEHEFIYGFIEGLPDYEDLADEVKTAEVGGSLLLHLAAFHGVRAADRPYLYSDVHLLVQHDLAHGQLDVLGGERFLPDNLRATYQQLHDNTDKVRRDLEDVQWDNICGTLEALRRSVDDDDDEDI